MIKKIYYLCAILALFLLRIYKLDEIGLAEYDSVYNFKTIQEICQGDFSHLFQHGSPTFYLVFSIFYLIYPHYLLLEYVNAAIGVAAVVLIVRLFAQYLQYSFFKELLLLLLAGTSVFLVYNTRSLTIENLSLLFFVWVFYLLLRNLQNTTTPPDRLLTQSNYAFWIVVSLFLTINYKIILLFPLLLFILHKHHKLNIIHILNNKQWYFKSFTKIFSILLLPFILYSLIGVQLGLQWFSYIGHWVYVLVLRKNINPWKVTQTLHWDIDYYFQYIYFFENPFLLIGLLVAVGGGVVGFRQATEKGNLLLRISTVLVVGVWLLMSFLPKAPRALLFIYPFLHLFTFWVFIDFLPHQLKRFTPTRNWLMNGYALIITMLIIQFFYLHKHIYRYASSNYAALVTYLSHNNIQKLAITVGINSYPFLPPNVTSTTILHPQALIALRAEGYRYCLVDDFLYVAGALGFDTLVQQQGVWEVREPTLLAPIMYLEHCEFTGYTFREAWELQQKIAQKPYQLKIIELK